MTGRVKKHPTVRHSSFVLQVTDGRKIEGRRIKVDVERGRTVEGWKPRRLAGGLGGEGRLPREPKKKKLDHTLLR